MDTTPTPAASNVPEYAVSEIAGAVRRTLEGAFGRVRVRGEVCEAKRYPSGHWYLSLKDENAKLESVIWKTTVPRLAIQPENGVEVIATGRITTYADRSKYQLVIDRLEFAGEGALLARIEMLRKKLLAEGLFEEDRKRPLPRLPAVVGVVSSEAGAVIQDIRTTILRRFPRRVILWPVAVQGKGGAEKIAAAIAGFNALPAGGPIPRPDVLIVARGGGSLEDLMAFNEEVVVRAAAASAIPLISAVGHETDTTLIDFASDRRAPTPTAAAELAVPARADLLADLAQREARLRGAMVRQMRAAETVLLRLERRLPDVPARVADLRRRLDEAEEGLAPALASFVRRRHEALARLPIPHPRAGIAARRATLALLEGRKGAAFARLVQRAQGARALQAFSAAPLAGLLREKAARLAGLAARLESGSYQSVLARGFALVRDAQGHALTRAAQVAPGAKLQVAFADGEVAATAEGEALKRGRSPKTPPAQESLL
ncbi:exodeoxyribonuclease VII large subunit [Falsiroseomonas tokyonensis]|uniref:Exodeoxyribonuclease 7 large subunit n=1 Tax=Falsiroseomonas tokyonensis TaxID=430521 RepID=A0ABV7C1A0_9PROT|nr:exodeoxyribonuclease VII large subunit [Falsiroseomonas tokyonensis]MBU8541021.1 exodeoxyribonuclease VII large subunit [Falsiroseomonas tokyonensis]